MGLYGYGRLSKSGDADSMSRENQERVLREFGVPRDRIYFDNGVSGSVLPSRRPEYQRMSGYLEPGDSFVVVRLDRLTRSTLDGLALLAELRSAGIGVRCLSPSLDLREDSAAVRLQVGIYLVIAEYERGLAVERTMEGLKTARSAGKHLGRPGPPEGVWESALAAIEGGMGIRAAGRKFGVSPSGLRGRLGRNK